MAVSGHRPTCGNRGKPETDAKFEVGLTNQVSAERSPHSDGWKTSGRRLQMLRARPRVSSVDDASAVRGNFATRMSLGGVLRAAARSRGTCHGRDFNLGNVMSLYRRRWANY